MEKIITNISFSRELIECVASSPIYELIGKNLDVVSSLDEYKKLFAEREINFDAFNDIINIYCEISDLMVSKSYSYIKSFEIESSKIYVIDIFLEDKDE